MTGTGGGRADRLRRTGPADGPAGRAAEAGTGGAYAATGTADAGAADEERVARAGLCRVLEPGDEHGGRWLRELGPVELLRRLTAEPYRSGSLTGAGERRLRGYLARAARVRPEQDLELVGGLGGRFVVPGDAEWPSQLDDLGDARPLGLWVRGPSDLRRWALRSVAVVGARACTSYGAHMAAVLGAGLAERGWVVVSGAAFGVDGATHRGALGAGGATVAVLACGVDVAYPRGHAALIGRIAQQGLVVGELPPGDHPTPPRFLLRNRVIAALTRGTVVVEAAHRSGALATARDAQRLGRHTMGVPGAATSALSAGVHELLRGGATLVTDADDVVELVGDIGELAPDRRGPVVPRDLLDPLTARVLDALPRPGRTATVPEVATSAGTSVDDALGRLYELHSLGYVERHGDIWRLTTVGGSHPDARRGSP
ncbi:DNA-processing protein DprA [Streptomyces somaliensis]|uniref:DNA-protecting protein DprA n=2 Tax=Streptomyces somaliensis TaxID=78355 RepID=A0AA44DFZ5_STRE0|nr:DNA-processing protein DprA [Streptomyces somaliensis]NKY15919.1 DNA-protecting protein DprA [Streptomyces somaliensis DSM 40738]